MVDYLFDEKDCQSVLLDKSCVNTTYGSRPRVYSSVPQVNLQSKLLCNLKTRDIFVIITCALVNFSCYLSQAILAPFFPQEAEKRGLNNTEIGLIMGVFAMTSFTCSLIFGRHIGSIGAKLLLCYGMLLIGTSQFLFALLYFIKISQSQSFRNMAILVRALEGIGNAAATISSIAILSQLYPKKLGMVMSVIEIFAGLGGILAPSIGGFLYDLHNYTTPFYFSGTLQLLTLFVCIIAIKPVEIAKHGISFKEVWKIIRIRSNALCALIIICSAANLGVLDVGFSLYLTEKFGLPEKEIGLYFSTSAISYAGVGLFVGYITDKSRVLGQASMVCGGFLQFISFFLMAPIPFFADFLTPSTGTVISLQVLFGIGLSCSLLPSYNEMVRSTLSNGTQESIMVYGIISAIFNSSYNAGEGIGPLFGGYIVDKLKPDGFEWAVCLVSSMSLVVSLVMIVYYLCHHFQVTNLPLDTEEISESERNNRC